MTTKTNVTYFTPLTLQNLINEALTYDENTTELVLAIHCLGYKIQINSMSDEKTTKNLTLVK